MRNALPLAMLALLLGTPAGFAAQGHGDRPASHDRGKTTERRVDEWFYDRCARILANPEDYWSAYVKRCRAAQH